MLRERPRFRELLGSLMYLYIGTRPDLSFAIQCFGDYLLGSQSFNPGGLCRLRPWRVPGHREINVRIRLRSIRWSGLLEFQTAATFSSQRPRQSTRLYLTQVRRLSGPGTSSPRSSSMSIVHSSYVPITRARLISQGMLHNTERLVASS